MKRIINLSLFLLCLITSAAQAIGTVYIQNNTGLTLNLETSQYGDKQLNQGDQWDTTINAMIPWQKKAKVLWYNRNSGISWGKDFYFDTRISINGRYITTIKQKLVGTWRFSNLYHGAEGDDFNNNWSQGYDVLTQPFSIDNKQYEIHYTANYNSATASDDIVYALHEVSPYSLPTANNANQLKVLSYNVYTILTNTAEDINRRVSALPNTIKGYDVIIFEEAFYNPAREDLIANIATEYPYTTDILDTSGYLEDGGVFIASKWPIELEQQVKYSACSGVDCLSPKGAMYAKILKQDQSYHIFGTHLQAEDSSSAVAARLAQLHELKAFIDIQNIPVNEAVIIGGDMNVDKLSSQQEYQNMLNALNASMPSTTEYSHAYSYDDATNSMASGKLILDYILTSNEHAQPIQAEQAVLVLKSNHEDMFGLWDYADHYSVFSFLEF